MEAVKSIVADLLSSAVVVGAPLLGLWIGLKLMGLDKLSKVGFKMGQRMTAPVLGGARNVSGRIAHWGAGRGPVGRTFARLATGAVFPGGRSQMERIGEAYRKGASERTQARGSYRMTPSDKMNAEALERVQPDALKRWVNSDDPNVQKAVKALRKMVLDTPAIKLSTAQRDALFSGGGEIPTGAAPPIPGMSAPTAPQANPGMGPVVAGGPGMPGNLPPTDSTREGGALGNWWRARPTVLPGPRMRGQGVGQWLVGHYAGTSNPRSWASWAGRFGSSSPRGAANPAAPGRPNPAPGGPPLPPPASGPARPGY